MKDRENIMTKIQVLQVKESLQSKSDALWEHVGKEGPSNFVRKTTKPWAKTGSMKIQ